MNKLNLGLSICSLVLLVVWQTGAIAAEETVELSPRTGATIQLVLIPTDKAVASVILFPGGDGIIGISSYGIEREGNFLVRSRDLFADNGLLVAVVDAPSDKAGGNGMLYGFRTSTEHVADIDAVIDYLQKKANIPVWLIGTSRGTESAAYVAINTSKKIGGVVLTSSVTERNNKGTAVTKMELDKITVPVLIASHKKDGCHITPSSGAKKIKSKLKNAPVVEIKYYKGGKSPISKPCKAKSEHGFYGIEEEVVDDIANFVKRI